MPVFQFDCDKTITTQILSDWKDSSQILNRFIPYLSVLDFAILQFEIASLMNLIFSSFQTRILQATARRKIQFELGKNPVQIDRG